MPATKLRLGSQVLAPWCNQYAPRPVAPAHARSSTPPPRDASREVVGVVEVVDGLALAAAWSSRLQGSVVGRAPCLGARGATPARHAAARGVRQPFQAWLHA